jgi:hypothetical protein
VDGFVAVGLRVAVLLLSLLRLRFVGHDPDETSVAVRFIRYEISRNEQVNKLEHTFSQVSSSTNHKSVVQHQPLHSANEPDPTAAPIGFQKQNAPVMMIVFN